MPGWMVAPADGARDMADTAQALRRWLVDHAYPLWSASGIDRAAGGFFEGLDRHGHAVVGARRARVAARQIYAFAHAPALGWRGDAAGIVEHGHHVLVAEFLRPDGICRPLAPVTHDTVPAPANLYDQAFTLFALAEAQHVLGARRDLVDPAEKLRAMLLAQWSLDGQGFRSDEHDGQMLLANPHMHLFEAALAWCACRPDETWQSLADEIGELAMTRLIDVTGGYIREVFGTHWSRMPGEPGRLVEPGHQFEWAFLLLRWRPDDLAVRGAARRLIDVGCRYGVRDGVARNALLDDLTLHDGAARLWPQTEWLRAAARAAELFGDIGYTHQAQCAARAVRGFLDTDLAGLWRDRLDEQGIYDDGPAPASSLYHLVSATVELVRIHGRQAKIT